MGASYLGTETKCMDTLWDTYGAMVGFWYVGAEYEGEEYDGAEYDGAEYDGAE